jgi:hypothetical protein
VKHNFYHLSPIRLYTIIQMPTDFAAYEDAHAQSPAALDRSSYDMKYENIAYLVTQTKLLHKLQQTLSALSTEARDSMFSIINMYLANEVLSVNTSDDKRRSDLATLTQFFNDFYDSDKFWHMFYKFHSKNMLIQDILELVSKEPKSVLEMCVESGVDTSMAYSMMLRTKLSYLPSDPRPTGVSWYDFLHPGATKMSLEDFKAVLNENNIRLAFAYEQWRDGLSAERRAQLPSVSHITDGYFMGKNSFGEVVA